MKMATDNNTPSRHRTFVELKTWLTAATAVEGAFTSMRSARKALPPICSAGSRE